ncbi:MAG: FkbM family methyltransferase [Pseudomonadota bacterium]
MLSKLALLKREVANVVRVCGTATARQFASHCVAAAPTIARQGTLQAADARMGGSVDVSYRGAEIRMPVGEADRTNMVENDSPMFAAIREIFGRDVYLRGFAPFGPVRTMLDLGANRGVVSLMAAKALGAEWVAGVEPLSAYRPVAAVLAEANDLTAAQRHRIEAFVGAEDTEDSVTVETILAQHGVERLDLLKVDIEGAENAVFLDGPTGFLARTERIVCELHPDLGSKNEAILDLLRQAGFAVAVTDPVGRPCAPENAEYAYAARDAGALTGARLP